MQKIVLGLCGCLLAGCVFAATPIVWQATFHDVMPNNKQVMQAYCIDHSPDVFQTTVKAILGPGAVAKNGVRVKYFNYHQFQRHGLHFITVNAEMSGVLNGKKWQQRMWLYEQTLTPVGNTDVIWATPMCKGKFTGVATNAS